MYSTIILRDIPKEVIGIDLWSYNIQGGFRGFQIVPPGLHHISIRTTQKQHAFWLFSHPNEVIVKIFDSTQHKFFDDEPDSAMQYQELAMSGAMNKALLIYPHDWFDWLKLTRHISSENLPLITSSFNLNNALNQHPSRFELALFDTHKGDENNFLAEFQFAFVRWLLSDKDIEDVEAYQCWRHLLLSVYNAGEERIAQNPDLFCNLIDTLLVQFNYLPDSMLAPDSFVCAHAHYLIEDMIDTNIPLVVEKGHEFSAWFANTIKDTAGD
jgi:AAR2 protein